MSDTPRTDLAERVINGPNPWDYAETGAVHASFARELERENSELRAQLATARQNASPLWQPEDR